MCERYYSYTSPIVKISPCPRRGYTGTFDSFSFLSFSFFFLRLLWSSLPANIFESYTFLVKHTNTLTHSHFPTSISLTNSRPVLFLPYLFSPTSFPQLLFTTLLFCHNADDYSCGSPQSSGSWSCRAPLQQLALLRRLRQLVMSFRLWQLALSPPLPASDPMTRICATNNYGCKWRQWR